MLNAIFGDKTTKLQVVMALGAAVVAVYEAITTINEYKKEKKA